MFSSAELNDYKLQVEMLQEKLEQSEENRQRLEQQLDKILQKQNDHKKNQHKQIRRRYEQFLEEQKKHSERNKRLMQLLEDIDQQASALSARSERLKRMKLQYEMYVSNLMQPQSVRFIQTTSAMSANTKSIPVLVPTATPSGVALPTLNTQENRTFEACSHNIAVTPDFGAYQWTLAMASPIPAAMWLMPSSNLPATATKPEDKSFINIDTCNMKNNNQSNIINETVIKSENNANNKKLNDASNYEKWQTVEATIASIDNENTIDNDKMQTNTFTDFDKGIKNSDETKKPDEQISTNTSTNETAGTSNGIYENQCKPQEVAQSVEPKKEQCSKVDEELPELENEFNYLNMSTTIPIAAEIMSKVNLCQSEDIVYEDLDTTLYNNPSESQANALENDENISSAYAYDVERMLEQHETEAATDDYNYAPTLVTTEAELYTQPELIQNNSATDNQSGNDSENNALNYENIDYANYDAAQYGDTVYPGYTYDETTGQYMPDEAKQTAAESINYETSNMEYDYSNYAEIVENPVVEEVLNTTNTEAEETLMEAENTTTSNTPSKIVKPILAAPSVAGANEAHKKKKRVNFVDSSDTDESLLPGKMANSSSETTGPAATTTATAVSSESEFDMSASENVESQAKNET